MTLGDVRVRLMMYRDRYCFFQKTNKTHLYITLGPSTQAPGSARQVAPALGAPLNAISNPNSKQTQHGNDRRFYYPDLLHVPTNSTTAHPVDQVRVQGVVKIETLPESPTMLQGPSRGLCSAQT